MYSSLQYLYYHIETDKTKFRSLHEPVLTGFKRHVRVWIYTHSINFINCFNHCLANWILIIIQITIINYNGCIVYLSFCTFDDHFACTDFFLSKQTYTTLKTQAWRTNSMDRFPSSCSYHGYFQLIRIWKIICSCCFCQTVCPTIMIFLKYNW